MEGLMNTMHKKLTGVVVPLLTPIDRDGRIDLVCYENLVQHCYDHGVLNFFMMGTAGEGSGVTETEKLKAIACIAKKWSNKAHLICGVLEPTTVRAVEWIHQVEQLGISRFAITPPYYDDVTMDDIYEYYRIIGDAANKDTILYVYNIPGTTGIDIPVALVGRIKALGNYGGIKNSAESLVQLINLIDDLQDDEFSVLQGYEDLAVAGLIFGADGIVPCDANIYPGFFAEMVKTAKQKNYEKLFAMNHTAKKILDIQNFSCYWLASLKAAAEIEGIGAMEVTAPYKTATPEEKQRLRSFILSIQQEIDKFGDR
jgi:4-hydroxy-tetrahydrodipicolinate synthase